MKKIITALSLCLYKPYYVFLFCLCFLALNIILDGTLFQIFKLNQDLRIVQNRIELFETKNKDLKEKIKEAKDPDFIEKELRDRLDYTEEGDLIFLFPDNI